MTLFCFVFFNAFCEFSISEERCQAATFWRVEKNCVWWGYVAGDHAFIIKHLLLL